MSAKDMDALMSLFFRLGGQTGQRSTMMGLPRTNEIGTSDKGKRWWLFTHALYGSEESAVAELLDGLPQLSHTDREALDSNIIVQEVTTTVTSMRSGKSDGFISLFPKKVDLTLLKNWHQKISLLCTDYKILSKVLAKRLKYFMDQIIRSAQSYCVPGKSI